MKVDVNLDIFEGISKFIEPIRTWWILRRLQKIRYERFKHKVLNKFYKNPLIDNYIEELDKMEVDLRSQLRS